MKKKIKREHRNIDMNNIDGKQIKVAGILLKYIDEVKNKYNFTTRTNTIRFIVSEHRLISKREEQKKTR